jgi:hypothetical protein
MTNDTRPRVYAVIAEDAPRERKAFGLTWNEADAKSAIITIGGTIAGGLVLVLMVGLALVLVHLFSKGKHPLAVWLLVIVPTIPVAMMALSISPFEKTNRRIRDRNPWLWRASIAGVLFCCTEAFLILIGRAAGTH